MKLTKKFEKLSAKSTAQEINAQLFLFFLSCIFYYVLATEELDTHIHWLGFS